jgi:predicted flap endonuclease-1-like 5' DNA nuclease
MNPHTFFEQSFRTATALTTHNMRQWQALATRTARMPYALPTTVWPWRLTWKELTLRYPEPSFAFDEEGWTRQVFGVASEMHRRSWEMAATVLTAQPVLPALAPQNITRAWSDAVAFWLRSADDMRGAMTRAATTTVAAANDAVAEAASAYTAPASAAPAKTAPAAPVQAELLDEVAPADEARPEFLSAPRGTPDDLTRLKGIGEKLSGVLHSLGIYHFWQIAGWTPAQMDWVNDHLQFKGRIQRERWVEQAQALLAAKAA